MPEKFREIANKLLSEMQQAPGSACYSVPTIVFYPMGKLAWLEMFQFLDGNGVPFESDENSRWMKIPEAFTVLVKELQTN